jgi:hypothetical protein
MSGSVNERLRGWAGAAKYERVEIFTAAALHPFVTVVIRLDGAVVAVTADWSSPTERKYPVRLLVTGWVDGAGQPPRVGEPIDYGVAGLGRHLRAAVDDMLSGLLS